MHKGTLRSLAAVAGILVAGAAAAAPLSSGKAAAKPLVLPAQFPAFERVGVTAAASTLPGLASSAENEQRYAASLGEGWVVSLRNGGVTGHLERARRNETLDFSGAGGLRSASEASKRVEGDAELEALARDFVKQKLGAFVKTVAGEDELVGLDISRERRQGQASGGRPTDAVVVATTVTFGRSFHGYPILGHGSRVAVTMAPSGEVVKTDFDWPAYKAVGATELAASDEVANRLETVVAARLGGDRVRIPASTALLGRSVPVANDVQLESVQCGLWDDGEAGALKPACQYSAVKQHVVQGGSLPVAIAGMLPIGASVPSAKAWPEAALLQKR